MSLRNVVYKLEKESKSKHFDFEDCYCLTIREKIFFFIKTTGFISLIAYGFFDSFLAFLCLLPLYIPFYINELTSIKRQRRITIRNEFAQVLRGLIVNLNTGYALESAFVSLAKEQSIMFPQGSLIGAHLNYIQYSLDNSIPIEQAVFDVADKLDIEEVWDFEGVIRTVKQSGGNLIGILESTWESINIKVETGLEIETAMAAKQLEQKLMSIMPIAIVLYLRISNAEYMNALYHNALGILTMSISLVVMLFANYIAARIVKIDI